MVSKLMHHELVTVEEHPPDHDGAALDMARFRRERRRSPNGGWGCPLGRDDWTCEAYPEPGGMRGWIHGPGEEARRMMFMRVERGTDGTALLLTNHDDTLAGSALEKCWAAARMLAWAWLLD